VSCLPKNVSQMNQNVNFGGKFSKQKNGNDKDDATHRTGVDGARGLLLKMMVWWCCCRCLLCIIAQNS
jgi:hypothetical protein